VVNATPQPLYPRERAGTHCIRGWVGPRAGVDGCRKSRPHRHSIPGRPARSEVIHRLRYPGSGMRVPGENLPHCHFVDHEPHGDWPGIEPGVLQWDDSSCHHSLGQALTLIYSYSYFTQRRIAGFIFVISGFRREADENCALLCYNAASGRNFLPTFRNNLSVPSSGVKNCHYWLRKNPEEHSSLLRFHATRLPCNRYM
jgi:hypothetical protein